MQVKVTPATPLPWSYESAPDRGMRDRAAVISSFDDRPGIVSGRGAITLDVSGPDGRREQATQNAAYIAHAANAYPRLVDRLQTTLRWLATLETRNRAEDVHYQRIEALLRELGEAE